MRRLHPFAFSPSRKVKERLGRLIGECADDFSIEAWLDFDGARKVKLFFSRLLSTLTKVQKSM
jgi:hypothetical protein